MQKITIKKSIVLIAIIVFAIIVFSGKTYAIDIPKVQNVKAIYNKNGTVNITWDKINTNSGIEYHAAYTNIEEGGGIGYFTKDNNKIMDLKPGYTYSITVTAKSGEQYGENSEPIIVSPKLGKTSYLKANTTSESSISVYWDWVNYADGYEVYLYNMKTKKYECCAKKDGYANTSFNIENLKPSTEYKIKVRAYSKVNENVIYGTFSDELKMTTTPCKVKNIKTSVTSKGIKLKWDKVSGATGYIVYRAYEKNGVYYEWKTISKNTDNFTDELAYSGNRFYYKIKAFKQYNNENYLGPDSNVISQVFVSTPKISVKSYNDKATIKWDKVSSASGYVIYRATSKGGEYEKIKTIKKGKTTSYTDKKIKSKKVYYYKVKAYQTRSGKKYYSAYSSTKEKARYAQIEITKTTYISSKKSNTLKWKKVSGVTGYKIYRATSKNGKYKHIKTISKNSIITYTDKKDIRVGKLYYYKIRAYKKSGSKTHYGQYSSAKKRTTGSRKQQMNKIKLKTGKPGFVELEEEYTKIVKKVTKGKKTVYDKVKACYKYVVENMSHDDYHCKQFSGTFAGLIKVLGIENVYCACGETTTTSGGWTGHTWVIMEINDTKYVFDPSIDKHILESTGKINYSRFFKTESEVSKKYKLQNYHSDAWPVLLSTGAFGVLYY